MTFDGGTLLIELASATVFDQLHVSGGALLGGTLETSLLGGYLPKPGDTFQVMTWAKYKGRFSLVVYDVRPLVPVYSLTGLTLVAALAGDANLDGKVDELDASILGGHWRMSAGATWSDGDFNGDGNVTDADAAILAAHWGEGTGEESVPEPTAAVSLLLGLLTVAGLVARHRK